MTTDPLAADLAARGWGVLHAAPPLPPAARCVMVYEAAPEPAYALTVELNDRSTVTGSCVFHLVEELGGWIAAPASTSAELPTVEEAAGAWEAWQATGPEELKKG
jgi:hypothetical protein